MSQFILINRIKVQNANAVAGFTWGFPAITHFLGFAHSLGRKLQESPYSRLSFSGTAVIAHEHHVHVYGAYGDSFTQSRSPPYLHSHDDKAAAPPVIEEGKMNMTVSLLIGCDGNIGNQDSDLLDWLNTQCYLQRLAGGTILEIGGLDIVRAEEVAQQRTVKRKLLPGFVLVDRSASLQSHYENLTESGTSAEQLEAWLDFSAYKEQARPNHNLIDRYLQGLYKMEEENSELLWREWSAHLERIPYDAADIPDTVKSYFAGLEGDKNTKSILDQWNQYLEPTEKTAADWERLPKPEAKGYLVPIVCGYKAITPVYKNDQIENTRDSETPVCFVEAVHSVGEWRSVHHLRSEKDFNDVLWTYHHEDHWYLCRQSNDAETISNTTDNEF